MDDMCETSYTINYLLKVKSSIEAIEAFDVLRGYEWSMRWNYSGFVNFVPPVTIPPEVTARMTALLDELFNEEFDAIESDLENLDDPEDVPLHVENRLKRRVREWASKATYVIEELIEEDEKLVESWENNSID
jgi:hypothetical protein